MSEKPVPQPVTQVVPKTSHGKERAGALGCVLYVAEGAAEDKGRHLSLRQGTATVGTAPSCDLQLHDATVSRQHAEFSITKDGVGFRDPGSTNGTHYLGQRIQQAHLKHGARLRMGSTVIMILPLADAAGIEPDESTQYGDLMGASMAMRRLFSVLRRLETSDAPVLVVGETGTGKELVARTLHAKSERHNKAFVVLDCGAIPRELVDSELFGHNRGSFTGAVADRAGVFEEADGGTLFLDEIGELPLEQQPRLLRVLETGEVRRVGANTHRKVDVRVIAATHRDLNEAVRAGKFREDLYYRLAVVNVTVPALRERPEAVPLLAQPLVGKLRGQRGEPLPESVVAMMANYPWPGNVRELRNAVHRLVSLGELPQETLDVPEEARTPVDSSRPYKEAREQVVAAFEAEYVRALLKKCDGNISHAARAAGIARRYFKELMRKHGLYDEQRRDDDDDE
ncbi:MAG: sigma 54-dependent Fis family transcriptional regulator [Deltaproteobacteria bacterium]|nr:sigma 54-dependent Fis family transcriptional regulator [Deltaproteobacteria bacterium]